MWGRVGQKFRVIKSPRARGWQRAARRQRQRDTDEDADERSREAVAREMVFFQGRYLTNLSCIPEYTLVWHKQTT